MALLVSPIRKWKTDQRICLAPAQDPEWDDLCRRRAYRCSAPRRRSTVLSTEHVPTEADTTTRNVGTHYLLDHTAPSNPLKCRAERRGFEPRHPHDRKCVLLAQLSSSLSACSLISLSSTSQVRFKSSRGSTQRLSRPTRRYTLPYPLYKSRLPTSPTIETPCWETQDLHSSHKTPTERSLKTSSNTTFSLSPVVRINPTEWSTFLSMIPTRSRFLFFFFFSTGIASPDTVDPQLLDFLKQQAPGAKYILTVCVGSWILAGTGLLNGRKATTNKAFFKRVVVRPKHG